MKYISIILALSLFACASKKAQYENKLISYNQTPEYRVIADYGQPHEVYEIDKSTKVISYYDKKFNPNITPNVGFSIKSDNVNIDTITPTLIVNSVQYAHGLIDPEVGEQVFYDSCKTNFTIQNGYVIDSGFSGNNCGN
tara:strand:- start:848 stop:1264 length:417 start_codon:yes stop_codon:yes gene_type:complete